MPVHHVTSSAEYQAKLKEAGDKLVSEIVCPLTATRCGPCKRISPFLEDLSGKMSNVVFLKVDVDELEDVARQENISAMPTFYLYKKGTKIADLVGAAQDKLKELIEKNA